MYRLASILITVACFITWLLISLGATVRLFGAGLACPDWPLCYGSLTPSPTLPILLEVGHRYLASILGLILILIYLLCIWCADLRKTRKLSGWLLFLVVFQGLVGGLTVLFKLNFSTVVVHLLLGNLLFFGLICLFYEIIFPPKIPLKNLIFYPTSKKYKQLRLLSFLFFFMLFTGGLNSSNYAGYACQAFPLCNSQSSFSFFWDSQNSTFFFNGWKGFDFKVHFLEAIHLFHRLVVILGSIVLGYFSIRYWLKAEGNAAKEWKILGFTLLILLFLEILVGITNALFRVPIPISILHTALSASITGILGWGFSLSKYKD